MHRNQIVRTTSMVSIISTLAILSTLIFPAQSVAAASDDIRVQWLTQGRSDAIEHSFKADMADMNESEYSLHWTVNDSTPVSFSDVGEDKQTWIGLDSWTWNGDGPYELTFIAIGDSGDELARTSFDLYRVEAGSRDVMVSDSDIAGHSMEVIDNGDVSEESSGNTGTESDTETDGTNDSNDKNTETDTSDDQASDGNDNQDTEADTSGDDAATVDVTGSASDATIGESSSVTLTVTNTGDAIADAIVDLEIYNENGEQIFQEYESGQDLGSEQTYEFAWSPGEAGTYTVKAGIFSDDWSTLHGWYDEVATVIVTEPDTSSDEDEGESTEPFDVSGTVTGVSDSSDATVALEVTSNDETVKNAIVDAEIHNEGGDKIFQQFEEGQTLSQDEAVQYSFTWEPQTAGTYTLKGGIFSESWSSTLVWNDSIETIEVTSDDVSDTDTSENNESDSSSSDDSGSDTTLSGDSYFYNEYGPADRQYEEWKDSRPDDAELIKKIADQPIAKWLGGWNDDITRDVDNYVSAAHGEGQVPVMVAYNIPNRDCGSYSDGGLGNMDEYRNWINGIADGIDGRDSVVIIEPDAAALTSCLDTDDRDERLAMLGEAAAILESAGADAYIDASHANWLPADDMADRLNQAGIEKATGFALNTSNFVSTEKNRDYGQKISEQTGGAHFVIDTSRNGNGATSDNEWCNPEGRALGEPPHVTDDMPLVDAFVWAKVPGESDGNCNGGPDAGQWWPEYALGLAERADW